MQPHVFQSERYFYIANIAKRSNECGGGLVRLGERYLVIVRLGI
jgi:hypothetical protein